jgi:hypothetical protein
MVGRIEGVAKACAHVRDRAARSARNESGAGGRLLSYVLRGHLCGMEANRVCGVRARDHAPTND